MSARTITALLLAISPSFPPGDAGAQSTARWYRGNTHTHTAESDGDSPPDSVVRWYRDNGYAFLFITDHEKITHSASLSARFGSPGKFLLIAGQEVTQRVADATHPAGTRQAHVNSLGSTSIVMPLGTGGRVAGVTMREAYARNIAAIRTAGGLAQVNHPNWRWSVRLDDLAEIPDSTLLEIANAHTGVNNGGGVDETGRRAPSAEALWDSLLTRGKLLFAVADDDSHSFKLANADDYQLTRPGRAWVMVRAESLTTAAILSSLRRGDFYSSTGIAFRELETNDREVRLVIQPVDQYDDRVFTTEFIGSGGKVLTTVHGRSAAYHIHGDEGYVRARVTDSNGRNAWTQAVTLSRASSAMDSVRWLLGCWDLSSGNRNVLEQWVLTRDGEMTGTSRMTVGGVERESERLRLYAAGDTLVYAAHPSGQPPAEFRAPSSTRNQVIFENLAHDFPQRIIYKRSGADSLIASIEGDRGGQRRVVTYPYRRVECPAAR
jgi:hypothetical protein